MKKLNYLSKNKYLPIKNKVSFSFVFNFLILYYTNAHAQLIPFANWKTQSAPVGSALFTTVGTQNWTVPAGVTSISVVMCGGGGAGGGGSPNQGGFYGGGGGGGGFLYKNNVTVTPGATLSITVGAGGTCPDYTSNGNAGGTSQISTLSLSASGGGGGGNGNSSPGSGASGGSGSGTGATSFSGGTGANAGTWNGSGGGAGGYSANGANGTDGGANGAAISPYGPSGSSPNYCNGNWGGGGPSISSPGGSGSQGFVRIIWGAGRSFPNTNVGIQGTENTY